MNDAEKLRQLADFFKDDGPSEIESDLLHMATKIDRFGGDIPYRHSAEYRKKYEERFDQVAEKIEIFKRMDEFNNKEEL
jgi:hypothetical protein